MSPDAIEVTFEIPDVDDVVSRWIVPGLIPARGDFVCLKLVNWRVIDRVLRFGPTSLQGVTIYLEEL